MRYFEAWGLMLAASLSFAVRRFWHTDGVTIGLILASLIWLSWAARRSTTSLQDRVIKMEMRYRTDPLLPADVRAVLWRLSTPQIVALRFASDAELPALIERASRENLSGRDIKKAIVNWVPDWDRA